MDGHDRAAAFTALEAALAISPSSALTYILGSVMMGWGGEAAHAAYRSVQANPVHSITYVQLAAALTRLQRLEEAKAAATRVLELHPNFRYGRQFLGVNCAPALAASLGDALRAAGLPQ